MSTPSRRHFAISLFDISLSTLLPMKTGAHDEA